MLIVCRRLDRRQTQLRSLVSHQQHDLVCYQWLHEDALQQAGEPVTSHKKSILTELHKVSMITITFWRIQLLLEYYKY